MSDFLELNPSFWLKNVLSKKSPGADNPSPTGEPLYSYQIKQFEYENLKSILQIYSVNLNLLKRNTILRALFVIYCSEWWRRSFQGGSWSWSALLNEISMSEAEQNKLLLYEIAESGLTFWRRTVLRSSNGRREFLGTFATEGGLPINQLNSPNNWIERVLKSALENYLKYGSDLNQIIETRF